jgi:hypothetical protein
MKMFRRMILILAALAMVSCSMPGYTGGQQATDSQVLPPTEMVTTPIVVDSPTPEPPTLTPTVTDTPTPEFTPTLSTPMVAAISQNVPCLFGPGVVYGPVSSSQLEPGMSVPIIGRNEVGTWWQIQDPKIEKYKCWVDGSVTTASGDLASVLIVKDPLPYVTSAKISTKPKTITVAGCMGPIQPITISGTISTIGPTTVKWHFETQQGGAMASQVTEFVKYGSQDVSNKSFTPSLTAGTYWVRLVIDSPNKVVGETTYKIECP